MAGTETLVPVLHLPRSLRRPSSWRRGSAGVASTRDLEAPVTRRSWAPWSIMERWEPSLLEWTAANQHRRQPKSPLRWRSPRGMIWSCWWLTRPVGDRRSTDPAATLGTCRAETMHGRWPSKPPPNSAVPESRSYLRQAKASLRVSSSTKQYVWAPTSSCLGIGGCMGQAGCWAVWPTRSPTTPHAMST